MLTARIEQLQQGTQPLQQELFDLADDLNQLLETTAQRYSALITAKLSQPVESTPAHDYHHVDINHVEALQARTVAGETLALHAVRQLQLDQKLTSLGFGKVDSAAALGSIIGRMVSPGSELKTHDWLQSRRWVKLTFKLIISSGVKTKNIDMFITSSENFSQANYTK